MWSRKQHEEAAQKLSNAFLRDTSNNSINTLAVKLAQQEHLNPESIRTVVRLANVAVFENLFSKKASSSDPDNMLEFQIGDPESVIQQLHQEVQASNATKTAAYSPEANWYGDIVYSTPLEKVASVPTKIKQKNYSKQESIAFFKKAHTILADKKREAAANWDLTLHKLANSLVALDSSVDNRTKFEKVAVSELGVNLLPELQYLQKLTTSGKNATSLFGGEKLASVQANYIATDVKAYKPLLTMLKEASRFRKVMSTTKTGLAWIESKLV